MPVIFHKAKTVGLVSSAAPSFDSLINMSNAEFSAMVTQDRQALKDKIDRHTTAEMLGMHPDFAAMAPRELWPKAHVERRSDPLQPRRGATLDRQARSG